MVPRNSSILLEGARRSQLVRTVAVFLCAVVGEQNTIFLTRFFCSTQVKPCPTTAVVSTLPPRLRVKNRIFRQLVHGGG